MLGVSVLLGAWGIGGLITTVALLPVIKHKVKVMELDERIAKRKQALDKIPCLNCHFCSGIKTVHNGSYDNICISCDYPLVRINSETGEMYLTYAHRSREVSVGDASGCMETSINCHTYVENNKLNIVDFIERDIGRKLTKTEIEKLPKIVAAEDINNG